MKVGDWRNVAGRQPAMQIGRYGLRVEVSLVKTCRNKENNAFAIQSWRDRNDTEQREGKGTKTRYNNGKEDR